MMSKNLKLYLKAVSTLSGTIIGAGIFALPWVGEKVGLLTFAFYLLLLTPILILLHLLYAEIVLITPMPHRFIGYVYY